MDAVRERLRQFYAESITRMLKVRKTSANRILTIVQGDESMTIAKFNAEVNPDLADQLMDQCKARVIEVMADREMAKLDEPDVTVIKGGLNLVAPDLSENTGHNPLFGDLL